MDYLQSMHAIGIDLKFWAIPLKLDKMRSKGLDFIISPFHLEKSQVHKYQHKTSVLFGFVCTNWVIFSEWIQQVVTSTLW